jgi:hypothetical protein
VNNVQYPFRHTSNDLLFRLDEENSSKAQNYKIIVQNAEEVQDIQNAPAISMGVYLTDSKQMHVFNTVSIYAERGQVRAQARFLYMNDAALHIWKAMGKQVNLIGARHRPPQTALLVFGVPFSE